jgi:hypothetical protein
MASRIALDSRSENVETGELNIMQRACVLKCWQGSPYLEMSRLQKQSQNPAALAYRSYFNPQPDLMCHI